MGETRDSYDPYYFDVLERVEDRHFWFRARNELISALTGQIVAKLSSGYRVLEVGCGNGNVLRWLTDACPNGTVLGMDLFLQGLTTAKRRAHCSVVSGDLHHPPFRDSFNLIGIFDVLEHLEDDRAVLESLRSLLLPNGVLLISVPASPALWSYFDVAAHHCRRYELQELREKLTTSGFEVEFITPYMAVVFPLIYIGRKLFNLRSGTPRNLSEYDLKIVPGVNELLTFLLGLEARMVLARRALPFGTSLLAIARAR